MRIIAAVLAGIVMAGCSNPYPSNDEEFLNEIHDVESSTEDTPDSTLIRQGKAACDIAENRGRVGLYEAAYANTDSKAEYLVLVNVYEAGVGNYCPEYKDKVS